MKTKVKNPKQKIQVIANLPEAPDWYNENNLKKIEDFAKTPRFHEVVIEAQKKSDEHARRLYQLFGQKSKILDKPFTI